MFQKGNLLTQTGGAGKLFENPYICAFQQLESSLLGNAFGRFLLVGFNLFQRTTRGGMILLL